MTGLKSLTVVTNSGTANTEYEYEKSEGAFVLVSTTKTKTNTDTGITTKTVTDYKEEVTGTVTNYVVIGGQEIALEDGDVVSKDGSGNVIITNGETEKKYNSNGKRLFTVTFVDEDGTELQRGEVAENATPAYTGETPTKAADAQYTYTFSGWDKEIAVVTADATYTATYSSAVNQYNVTFTGPGVEMQTRAWDYGATPSYNGTPSYAGFIFAGWSPAITAVTGDATYTAQWIYYNPAPADTEIEDEEVPLADIEDEEVPLADLPLFFEDVADEDWYREAVAYVFGNDLMVGLTDDVFGVYDKTTGRQLAAILYRYADSTKTAVETYEGGVDWAAENGLTDGIDFDADANVTREQMVTMIYRLAQAEAVERDVSEFADADEISDYAAEAMAWAVENGIIKGYDTGCVAPKGEITRAEIATIIMRFATLAE